MRIITVHFSLLGGTQKVAEGLKYPTFYLKNYKYKNGDKIVIIARRFYPEDDKWSIHEFVYKHRENILGAVIMDDMNYGEDFGSSKEFFIERGVDIIAILDRIISPKQKSSLEGKIDERK